jgi:hypothetical protein
MSWNNLRLLALDAKPTDPDNPSIGGIPYHRVEAAVQKTRNKDLSGMCDMHGACAGATFHTWNLLGKPKGLTPHNMLHSDPKFSHMGHVALVDKKSGHIVDPAGTQFDPEAPAIHHMNNSPYHKIRPVAKSMYAEGQTQADTLHHVAHGHYYGEKLTNKLTQKSG